MKKIKTFWASLEGSAVISKRELFLGLTVCLLGGIVFGVFASPKKRIVIGSNNGNVCGDKKKKKTDETKEIEKSRNKTNSRRF